MHVADGTMVPFVYAFKYMNVHTRAIDLSDTIVIGNKAMHFDEQPAVGGKIYSRVCFSPSSITTW